MFPCPITIQRNGWSLTRRLKQQLYQSLVLDYCCVALCECSVELQNSIERIQNSGVRLILDRPPRIPSQELRDVLKWDKLRNRKRRFRLQMVQRCVHSYAPEYVSNRLNTNASLGCPCKRGYSKLNLNQPWCDQYKRSFEYMGSKDWTVFEP